MLKKWFTIIILIILDIALFNISVLAGFSLRFDFKYENIPEHIFSSLVIILVMNTILKLIWFSIFKLYSSLWRYAGIHEIYNIIAALVVSNIMIYFFAIYFDIIIPRSVLLIVFFIDIFFIGLVRVLYRGTRLVLKGVSIFNNNLKRVLLIGAGDAGLIVIKEMRNQVPRMRNIVAVLDDDIYKKGKKISGVSIIGTTDKINDICLKLNIDEIIIAIPSAHVETINRIYNLCLNTGRKVKIFESFSNMIKEKNNRVENIRDINIEDLLGRSKVDLNIEEVSSYINNKTILVTGGGGSIGSEIIRQVMEFNPIKVFILDIYENSAYAIYNDMRFDYPDIECKIIIANIRDRKRIDRIFKEISPDVIFHAAAHKHVPIMEENVYEAVVNNFFGTLNLVEASKKYNVEKFVLISSDKAVNPTNVMGVTKRLCEILIQKFKNNSTTKFVAVRFGNVLGSNGSVIPIFENQIKKGGPITVTHPDVTRYFMTINEAVQLVIEAGTMANGGEIFVLDMGKPIKIVDVAKKMITLYGYKIHEEIDIKFIGLRLGEKLFEEISLINEGIIKTKNQKIYIVQQSQDCIDNFDANIKLLELSLEKGDNEIRKVLKKIVKTYTLEENVS